jgi:hypothetical protein
VNPEAPSPEPRVQSPENESWYLNDAVPVEGSSLQKGEDLRRLRRHHWRGTTRCCASLPASLPGGHTASFASHIPLSPSGNRYASSITLAAMAILHQCSIAKNYLTSPHLPHLTSTHLTSTHLNSPHLTSPLYLGLVRRSMEFVTL